MADNRLFLACRRCVGAEITIARAFGGEWSPSRVPEAEYAAWLETHTRCADGGPWVLDVALTCENDRDIALHNGITSAFQERTGE